MLTRTQEKKFEDMFLVKIASKGTSLNFMGLENTELSFCYCTSYDFLAPGKAFQEDRVIIKQNLV